MQKLFFSYYRPDQTEIQRSKLKKDCIYLLERLGLPYEHVQGNFGGNLEDSFLVKKCSGEDVATLSNVARDYLKQDSVLVVNSYGGAALHHFKEVPTYSDGRKVGRFFIEYIGEFKTVANDNRPPSGTDYSYSPLKNQFYVVEPSNKIVVCN